MGERTPDKMVKREREDVEDPDLYDLDLDICVASASKKPRPHETMQQCSLCSRTYSIESQRIKNIGERIGI